MEFIKLLYLNLQLRALKLVEQIRILPLYWNRALLKIDWAYFKAYLFKSPYKLHREHFKASSEEIKYSYGETWPSTALELHKLFRIQPDDVLYDLGSGTGRISFWLQQLGLCHVVAVENLPDFIQRSEKMKIELQNKAVTFLEQNILDVDYSPATLIYFYGTSFSDEFIQKLLKKWSGLKPGVRIITTSYALNEYLDKPEYLLLKEKRLFYPWGKCDVYLQEKL